MRTGSAYAPLIQSPALDRTSGRAKSIDALGQGLAFMNPFAAVSATEGLQMRGEAGLTLSESGPTGSGYSAIVR